jgi:phosphoglucosamine mutase
MKLFGTDGIRGVAGVYPLDDATVRHIGAAAARVLKKEGTRPLILIGRDTRESGSAIGENLKAALSAEGIEVWDIGILPTPGIAYLVRQHPVLCGIVISASHNPYQDNGIKFFGPNGTKLPDAVEEIIENEIIRRIAVTAVPDDGKAARGTLRSRNDLVPYYSDFLKNIFPKAFDLKGFRIAIDCANGATCAVAQEILENLGADVIAINTMPDGRNINLHSGALHPSVIAAEVVRRQANCGLAFDGDGDRIIFADENGEVRDGDYLLSITSDFLKKKGKLAANTLVTTVMANLGLLRAMEERGITVLTTAVGDRYVLEGMVKSGAVIGGEQSGHIIFMEHLPTGDGILSALQMLAIMKETGQPLSQLSSIMRKYPQVLLNTRVSRKVPVDSLPQTLQAIKDGQGKLRSDGRVLVRYSGTENLLRIMIEGIDKQAIAAMAQEISDVARAEIENFGN